MINTPIAYIVFNRPRHTRRSFAAIRTRRPGKLFIIADGPRSNHPEDAENCQEVRHIVEHIDWPCEVHRNYAESNLGLKRRVGSGLNWVFEQVDRAIVLEDDCLPHPDFFDFCETLLDRYENDERIRVITGNNFQDGQRRGTAAYYFSKYPHCWGWASWRRAWRQYQGDLPFWPEWRASQEWCRKLPDRIERSYWFNIFEKVHRNGFDSWAYPWLACVWYHGGLTVTPNVNLVTNIGFGPDGTHTVTEHDQEGIPSHPLGPMIHPDQVEQDKQADRYVFDQVFGGKERRLAGRLFKLSHWVIRKLKRTFTVGRKIKQLAGY